MRLSVINKIFQEINENDFLKISGTSITNIEKFKQTYKNLTKTDTFNDELTKINEILNLKHITTNVIQLHEVGKVNEITRHSNKILNELRILKKHLQIIAPKSEDEYSLAIKLNNPHNISDITSILNELEQTINLIINHKKIEGHLKINNWEHGSFWIELGVATFAAVKIINAITEAASNIIIKIQEYKKREQELKTGNLKKETLEEIYEFHKEQIRKARELEAKLILENNIGKQTNENEYLETLKTSIKNFTEILMKGTEIYPQLPDKQEKEIKEKLNYNTLAKVIKEIRLINNTNNQEKEDEN